MLRSGLPVPCMTYRLLKHQLANKDCLLGQLSRKSLYALVNGRMISVVQVFAEDDSHHFGVGMGLTLDAGIKETSWKDESWLGSIVQLHFLKHYGLKDGT